MAKETEIKLDKKVQDGRPGDMKDPEKLNEAIANIIEAVDYHTRRKEVTERQFKLMIENPEPLNPNFAYEEREEWVEVARDFHLLTMEAKMKEIDFEIKGLEDRKETFEKLLGDE
jgi:hypothetical protein